MAPGKLPELSIIIPVLNEARQLPELLNNLSRQQAVNYELLLVDGGSTDGSVVFLQEQARQPANVHLISSPAGRGRQLNLGAGRAVADWLLFLHADSRFAEPTALRDALDYLQATDSQQTAGHFALSFRHYSPESSAVFYFYEWKARLGRPETIHGDQGFLLRRDFFRQVGPFREDLPVMEDTDFAERLRAQGSWLLLPAGISTSARRFKVEGLWQRQLLSALIMCFREIGWTDFFTVAPQVYREQQQGETLRLWPFFQLVQGLLAELPAGDAWQIWWRSGCYLRRHIWQLLFALDARNAYRAKRPVGKGRLRLTRLGEPLLDLLTDHPPGRFLATCLLYLWFHLTCAWLRRKESR